VDIATVLWPLISTISLYPRKSGWIQIPEPDVLIFLFWGSFWILKHDTAMRHAIRKLLELVPTLVTFIDRNSLFDGLNIPKGELCFKGNLAQDCILRLPSFFTQIADFGLK